MSTTPADAGTPGSPSPGDGGTASGNPPPTDGGIASGGPDAGAAASCPVTLIAQPPPACPAVRDTSSAVCRTIVPALPVQTLRGGVPGVCDDQEFDETTGALLSHVVQRFDPEGRLLDVKQLDAQGAAVRETKNVYDPCGRLVFTSTSSSFFSAEEDDYGPDGLLERRILQGTSFDEPDAGCVTHPFAYQLDAAGQPKASFDAVTCAPVEQFTFGPDGRLSGDSFFDTEVPGFISSVSSYSYLPDGGVAAARTLEDGFHSDYFFDDRGVLVQTVFGSNEPASALETSGATFGPDGRLLEQVFEFTSPGRCNSFATKDVFNYDAGVLVSDQLTYDLALSPATCGFGPDTTTTYTHPSANVQMAQVMDANGALVKTTKTIFDARGNVLEIDLLAPDGSSRPLTIRNYDCFAQ